MTKLMFLNTMMTPMMKHPISLGSMLMMQTILVSIYMSKWSKSSWFSYILFITIIGGMMVMFMYMASIASNEKFKPKYFSMYTASIMTIYMITSVMLETLETLEKKNEMKMMLMELEEMKTMSKFFNLNKMNVTIAMMTILLLTMVSVTTISSTFEGPLKKK
uniref:NADH dehydrogenase subunit 6 n=1 Tax=Euhemisphaerius bistriatus TaxID=3081096 RepID=UPI002E773454|nr:NADH dehydrogenase subunit 6 [Epyhemisphaerius bistriatus]WQB38527.1 NADH dehydrogenase subunit 6 [Epyhemisphaerius bistriatus]